MSLWRQCDYELWITVWTLTWNHVTSFALLGLGLPPTSTGPPGRERASPIHAERTLTYVHGMFGLVRESFCVSIYCMCASCKYVWPTDVLKTPDYTKSGPLDNSYCVCVCVSVPVCECAFTIYVSSHDHFSFPPFFARIKYDSGVPVGSSLPLQ